MKTVKQLLSYVILFVLLIVCGFAALFVVYQIPTDGRMRQNLANSIPIFEEEGDHPTWAGMKDGHAHYMGTVAENFTDAIMLSMADYSGTESSLNEMLVSRYYGANDVADSLKMTVGEKFPAEDETGSDDSVDSNPADSNSADEAKAADRSRSTENSVVSTGYGEDRETGLLSYGRFWNGYLVWLKPLLYFTDYGTMRMMGMILILALCVLLCLCTQRTLGTPYTVGVVITLAVLNPITISTSISYWADFTIMVISSAVLLHFYSKLKERKRIGILFAVTGSACAYFCWLFYPLVTVGVPLALFCALELRNCSFRRQEFVDPTWRNPGKTKQEMGGISGQKKVESLSGKKAMEILPEKQEEENHSEGKKSSCSVRLFLDVIRYGVIWGIFYLGTWGIKWVLATGLTGVNVLLDAENQVALRTSTTHENGMKLTAFHTIYNNLAVLAKAPYVLLFAVCLVWLVFYMVKKPGYADADYGKRLPCGIAYILIALIPFVWYAMTVNHSYIHVIIVYRDLAVAVLALWCWLVYTMERIQGRRIRKRWHLAGQKR